MESQPQNPEFRNNPDNLHPCDLIIYIFDEFLMMIKSNSL